MHIFLVNINTKSIGTNEKQRKTKNPFLLSMVMFLTFSPAVGSNLDFSRICYSGQGMGLFCSHINMDVHRSITSIRSRRGRSGIYLGPNVPNW